MADSGLYSKPQQQQKVATSSATNTSNNSNTTTNNTQNKKNPSKFYTHFMFKAIIVAIFLVIIPLFSSETPSNDVVNPSFFSRWWELFHLIFVGIAVSYGLFSRKNDELEGETTNSKFDSAQSYVSKLLQVPPVFDDEVVVDSSIGSDDHDHDNHSLKKIQTWSSQYYRNDPVVVVAAAKNGSNLDKNVNLNNINSGVLEKPLLLPVRSLKSRVSDEKDDELVNSGVSRIYARSNSSQTAKEFASDSRRISRNDVKLISGEDSGVTRGYTRSNSGKGFVNDSRRMSRNDSLKSRARVRNESGFVNRDGDGDGDGEVSRSLSKLNTNSSSRGYSRRHSTGGYACLDDEKTEECEDKVEEGVVLPSPIPWRSRSGSMEINRESFDLSPHSLPASLEESGAAHLVRSQSSLSARSSSSSASASSPKELSPSPPLPSPKRLSPSPSLASESLGKGVEDYGRRKLVYGSQLPPPPPPPPPPPFQKSKIVKSKSSQDNDGNSIQRKDLKRSVWSEPKDVCWGNREESLLRTKTGFEAKGRNGIDSSSVGKSVRTVRRGEMTPTWKTRENHDEEKRSEDISSGIENSERKTAGYNPMSTSSFSEFPKETRDFLEQVLVGTDDESESEGENYVEERVQTPKVEETHRDSVDEGPDVDKKADEFIAKFREQIRLQRIESIKRSTSQLKRSTVRHVVET